MPQFLNITKVFMENPFKYGTTVHGPYFADRTEELAELVGKMKNAILDKNPTLRKPLWRAWGRHCLG